jgi:hypothetical protein
MRVSPRIYYDFQITCKLPTQWFHMRQRDSSDMCKNIANVPPGTSRVISDFTSHVTERTLKFVVWRTYFTSGLIVLLTEN